MQRNDGKPNLEVQHNVGTNKASTGGDDKDHRRKEMAYKAREAGSWNQYPQQRTKPMTYANVVALGNKRERFARVCIEINLNMYLWLDVFGVVITSSGWNTKGCIRYVKVVGCMGIQRGSVP